MSACAVIAVIDGFQSVGHTDGSSVASRVPVGISVPLAIRDDLVEHDPRISKAREPGPDFRGEVDELAEVDRLEETLQVGPWVDSVGWKKYWRIRNFPARVSCA